MTDGFRRIFSKELLVGVLFAAGCALPVCSQAHWPALACPLAFFAALAWLNCRAIERWESGRAGVASTAVWVAMAAMAAAAAMAAFEPRDAAMIAAAAAGALLLAGLDRVRHRMTAISLRAAADLALLTPAVLLAAAWLVRP